MNENSKPKAPKLKDWLAHAADQLQRVDINSARLDAELILCSVLNQNRTWLLAHDDMEVEAEVVALANRRLKQRLNREPLAYIFGSKEFYGRTFLVTPDVLIPRPDTEIMIELLTELVAANQAASLVDVGTGSGAIAITAKLELPALAVTASDISPAALKVAADNASRLKAVIKLRHSNLLETINGSFDIICANLPYVDQAWQTSPETGFEPALALFADEGGLALIRQLISQAAQRQPSGGLLLLEADRRQHDDVIELARLGGYSWHQAREFIVVFKKN